MLYQLSYARVVRRSLAGGLRSEAGVSALRRLGGVERFAHVPRERIHRERLLDQRVP